MEAWRKVWRESVMPYLQDFQKERIKTALESNSPWLVQGQTYVPHPELSAPSVPCLGTCLLGIGFMSPGSVIDDVAVSVDQLCRSIVADGNRPGDIIDWWDNTPRMEAINQLLEELKEYQCECDDD